MFVALALATLAVQSPAADDPATARVLLVRSSSDLQLAEATVQRALEGHLADLGFDVHVDFAPGERPWPPASVRVELRTSDSGELEVTMQREADAVPWTRTVPDPTNADLRLESLGVLIRSMLGAPNTEAEPIAEPEPAPEPAPNPEPPPPAPPRHAALDLSIGYRGDTVAPTQRWHSGLGLDLGGRTQRGFAAGGALAYVPPHRGGSLQVQRVGGHLRLGAAFRPGRRIQPAAFAAASIEGVGWSGAPAGSQARPGWGVRVGAGVSGQLQVLLAQAWFLSVRLTALGWARGATLEEARGSARSVLLRTDPVSGAVWVGVGYRWSLAR